MMLSRGKVLVNLALKKSYVNSSATGETTSEGRKFVIQGKEIEEQLPMNLEQVPVNDVINSACDNVIAEHDYFDASLSTDNETLSATAIDVNNNELFVDNDDCSDGSLEYDDDVQDPDWREKDPQTSDTDDQDINNIDIDHEEIVDTVDTKTNSSKRKQHVKAHFMKEIQKRKRMKGEQYLGVVKDKDSGVKSYCVERAGKILCPRNCGRKCQRNSNTRQCPRVEDNDRIEIFEKFWKNMDWKEKKLFVINHVEKGGVNERTTSTPTSSRRKFSYKYFLTKSGERIPVCKNMFTTTLGIGERMVYSWLNDSESGIPNIKKVDKSSNNEEYKRCEESARDFLFTIPKLDSHYCRSSSKKKYLEPLFESKSQVYREYTNIMTSEGKAPYHKTGFYDMFEKMNLSLWQPKKDQCDKCCEHEAGNLDDEEYQDHLKKKEEARKSKIEDKERATNDASIKVLCMDLQGLLICPRLQASSLYYKMKLSCHNFTLYDMVTHKAKNYFWHEGEGELNANIFATCVIDYLDSIDLTIVKEIITYSDGCTYQNRNTTMANALLLWAAQKNVIVFQKYLERGHTQMECDSVHSCIERKIRKKAIYVPQMYVDNILTACSKTPYMVHYVDHTFFKSFDNLGYYSSIRPGTGVGSAVVTDIRVLKYLPEGKIQYKLKHDDSDFKDIPKPRSIRARMLDLSDSGLVHNLYNSSLAIKKTKYQHLLQLKSVIPKDYHGFYDNLLHSNL